MSWSIKFFCPKEDIQDAFDREINANLAQFTDEEAKDQASMAYEFASQMIYDTALLGEDVLEVSVELIGHSKSDTLPAAATPFVQVRVAGLKYPEPVSSETSIANAGTGEEETTQA